LVAQGLGVRGRDALLGRGQVRAATARREAARASLAARTEALAAAMCSGRFGPDHLDSLVRRLGRLGDDHLGRVQLTELLDRGGDLPADTFDAALRSAVDLAAVDTDDLAADDTGDLAADDTAGDEPLADEATKARAASSVRLWFDHRTGMGQLTGEFDPERYEALATAIEQYMAALANRPDGQALSKDANLAAEALHDLICGSGERASHLPHVTVVVDSKTLADGRHADTIAETAGGHGLSDDATARLCCDSVLRRVVLNDDGVPINVGRRHRTATSAQWAAIESIHRSCAWYGCDRPLSHCQAHHIREWSSGGPTDLDNLVPLCSHHHHLVHEGRWRIELQPDRSLHTFRPDGVQHNTTGPPTRRPPPLDQGHAP
jgi:hypothetical protein